MTKRLLIVDDDAIVANLYAMEIEMRDELVEVTRAEDGLQAVAVIEKNRPDLILLDLRLPKADGFHVLKHLHDNAYDLPVLVLTNYDRDDYRAKCAEYAIVHEYLEKRLIGIHELMEKLRSYLDGVAA
jgi:CheY-like chemotaxis protein